MPALLTLAEAAQHLRVSLRTVEREAAQGHLAVVRIRSRRMIAPAELTRYIAAHQAPACQSANEAIDTKCASASAAVNVLNAHFRQAQPSPTRARSKSRLAAPASTLRLVGGHDT